MNEALLKRYAVKHQQAFGAFEPINEPWAPTDMTILKDFYRKSRDLLTRYAPHATFVFHDAFIFDPNTWNDLFVDYDQVALDHHYYQAWYGTDVNTTAGFCQAYKDEAAKCDSFKMDVWFGEWSLATDVCAHWLGGFNDGNTEPQY